MMCTLLLQYKTSQMSIIFIYNEQLIKKKKEGTDNLNQEAQI